MVPIAVLIGHLAGRRHVGEAGRLRHMLGFGIVLARGLVFDGHAQVVAHGVVGAAGNIHPRFVGRAGARLRRGILHTRLHAADFLVVMVRAAGAAHFHVDQKLVPGIVKLPVERADLRGLLRQFGGGVVECVLRGDQRAKIDMREIRGSRLPALLGGRLPQDVALRDAVVKHGHARVQIGLLFRPVVFTLGDFARDRRQVEGAYCLVIAAHLVEPLRQLALQLNPMGGVFLDIGGPAHCGRAHAALLGQQRFHLLPVLPAILLFKQRQLVHRALRVAKPRLR